MLLNTCNSKFWSKENKIHPRLDRENVNLMTSPKKSLVMELMKLVVQLVLKILKEVLFLLLHKFKNQNLVN